MRSEGGPQLKGEGRVRRGVLWEGWRSAKAELACVGLVGDYFPTVTHRGEAALAPNRQILSLL
jgi:hypothetical protein